ncbi:HNH endonuclease [Pseudooceanicola atlanticus]|uniref:HNH endonuclease n=1 Tax=Pseudooceanicola atlanticus TaxID=1461694 RepID=UPI002357B9F6|nr:AP2 domain-containing protein [Pseudooceanicola atlanticus]
MDREARICACGQHGFVGLTKWHTALFDPEDLDIIAGHLWCVDAKRGRAYAVRAVGPKCARRFVHMHREVVSASQGQDVDHKNHDGIDNRKANLRTATRSQNNANQRPRAGKSRFKGVHWHRQSGKWHAQIRKGSLRKSLGLFECEEDAARAYDAEAVQLHGQFAATNETLNLYGDHK